MHDEFVCGRTRSLCYRQPPFLSMKKYYLLLIILFLVGCTPLEAKELTVKENPYSGGLEATTTFSPEMSADQIEAIGGVQGKQLEFAYAVHKEEKEAQKKAEDNELAKTVIKYAALLIVIIVWLALRYNGKSDRQNVTRLEPDPQEPSLTKELLQTVERRIK